MSAHDPDNDPPAATSLQGSCCVETDEVPLPDLLLNAPDVFSRLIRPRNAIPQLHVVHEAQQHGVGETVQPAVPASFVSALEEYSRAALLQSMGIAPGTRLQHLIGEVRSGLTNLLHELLHAVQISAGTAELRERAFLPKSAEYLAEGIIEYGTQLFFEDFVTALGIPNPEQILGSPNQASRPYSEQAAAVRTIIETFTQEFDSTPRTLLRQMIQHGGYPDGFSRFLERIGTKSGLTHECAQAVLLPDIHAQLDQLIDSSRPLRHDAEESGRFIGYLVTARMQHTIAAKQKVLAAPFSMN